jgi:type VI secretion system protein ImpK
MRLSDCFMEIIAYTAFAVRADGAEASFDQVHGNLQRLISESESLLQAQAFPREDYDLARFAVFAWIDETILSSQWEGRHQWQRVQLQRQYYQTTDAGELFYERLNTIGPHQRDVREVYYLCLALGFTGQYCNAGDDFMLEQLSASNLKLLTGSSMGLPSLEKQDLFPEAYPAGDAQEAGPDPVRRGRLSGFTLTYAAVPLVMYGLLYLIYLFILGHIGETLIGTVP